MYITFTLIIFVSAIILQTSVLHVATIGGGIKPDLILIIVVYLGLVKGSDIGCAGGFFFGLIEDMYSIKMDLGSNALTKTIVGFFCGISGRHLYTQSLLSQILCVGLGTIVDVVLLLSIKGFDSGPNWKQLLLYETLYNIVCCPFIVLTFRQGEKWLGAKSPPSKF
jgi:rod shape-determining protein MreD